MKLSWQYRFRLDLDPGDVHLLAMALGGIELTDDERKAAKDMAYSLINTVSGTCMGKEQYDWLKLGQDIQMAGAKR